MPLQIIYGRAHSGKTQYILDKAKELKDNSKPLIIVVPEQFTHLAEKRVLTKLGSLKQGMCEVLSFDRIAKRINSSYPTEKKQLSGPAQTLIIAEILGSLNLEYYKSASKTPGFADVCLSEISEFKKHLITPQMLDEALHTSESVELSMKLKDLLSIYNAYENAISDRFNDSDDVLNILADNLRKYQPYKGVTFFFDEFSNFNPQERNVISALAAQADNIYLSICCDTSAEYRFLFKSTIETAKLIKKACEDAGCDALAPVHLKNSYYENDEMRHLEKYLYLNPIKSYEKHCENINICSFESPYAEVECIAKKILKLVREHGVRFRDIGIVCSDIETYGFIVRSVFGMYEIPYFIDDKMPVLDHSIVSFVINILEVYLSGYNAETVVNYLKSGCIDADKEAIYVAENYILSTSAGKNTWLDDARWNKSVELYCDGNSGKKNLLCSLREKHILSLAKLHDKIKGRHSVKYISEEIYNYLIRVGFDKKIAEYIRLFKSENNICLAKQYDRVWKTLIDALDTLVFILGENTVNLEQYKKYLSTVLGQQKTGIIPTSLDEIIIGDVKRSKIEYVDYQFVLGVNDSIFPAKVSESGVITDEEKNALKNLGIELSHSGSDKAYFDRFLEYCVVTHPQKKLYISYPNSNADFSALRPAFVINMINKMFENFDESLSDVDDVSSLTRAHAREVLASSAAAISRGEAPDSSWKDLFRYFSDYDSEYVEDIKQYLCNNNQIKKLSPQLTEKMFGDVFYSTVSRIQKYNTCRYAYYLDYMLGLKEKKSFGITGVDIGSLIHEIIENVFSSMKNENLTLEKADNEFFSNKCDEYLNSYIESLTAFSGELSANDIFSVMRLKPAIVRSLLAIRDHIVNSAFVPLGHEIEFGDNNIGSIEIKLLNGKTLKITGKIDRADSFTNEDGTYVRVIDYKTGSKSFNFADAFYGLDIQLLVYMNALVGRIDNAKPAGALFFKIQNPLNKYDSHPDEQTIIKDIASFAQMDGIVSDNPKVYEAYSPNSIGTKNKLSSSQFRVLGEYIDKILQTSAEALSDGQIEINPFCKSSDNTSCLYCPYGSICNFEDGNSAQFRNLKSMPYAKTFFENISSSDTDKEDK